MVYISDTKLATLDIEMVPFFVIHVYNCGDKHPPTKTLEYTESAMGNTKDFASFLPHTKLIKCCNTMLGRINKHVNIYLIINNNLTYLVTNKAMPSENLKGSRA